MNTKIFLLFILIIPVLGCDPALKDYFTWINKSQSNAPSNLVATPGSDSRIDITWKDNSDNEEGFGIERKTDTGEYILIGTVGANITSYSDTNVIPCSPYTYRVYAFSATTRTDYSNEGIGKIDIQFAYSREVTIQELSGADLQDFQVKVNLDTQSLIANGKMKGDGSDIRFFESANDDKCTNGLPYWIEEGGINTTNTTIWVKLPLLSANQTKKISLFYGNPIALPKNNGDATFVFFDDFNSGVLNLSKWQIYQGTVFVQSGQLVVGDGMAGADVVWGIGEGFTGQTLEFIAMLPYDNLSYPGAGFGNGLTAELGFVQPYSDTIYCHNTRCGSDITIGTCRDTFHRYRIDLYPSGADQGVRFWMDGAVVRDSVVPFDCPPNAIFRANSYGPNVYVNWVFVRKWASVEPSVVVSP